MIRHSLVFLLLATISSLATADEYLHGQSDTAYQKAGPVIYGSDSTTYQKIRNILYNSDGTTVQKDRQLYIRL